MKSGVEPNSCKQKLLRTLREKDLDFLFSNLRPNRSNFRISIVVPSFDGTHLLVKFMQMPHAFEPFRSDCRLCQGPMCLKSAQNLAERAMFIHGLLQNGVYKHP